MAGNRAGVWVSVLGVCWGIGHGSLHALPHDHGPVRIEITGFSNDVLRLVLHGTQPERAYEIQTAEHLTDAWAQALVIHGAAASDHTVFEFERVPGTNALFFRALFDPSQPGAGWPAEHLLLWLRADIGVVANPTNSRVSLWQDQSGRQHHATQTTASLQPLWVDAVDDQRPVVRFGGNRLLNLPNFLTGRPAVEAVILLRTATPQASGSRGLWRFGTPSYSSWYPHSSGYLSDAFGRSALVEIGTPDLRLDTFHLYNVSVSASEWSARLNGRTLHQGPGSTPVFPTNLQLGHGGNGAYFDGDMVEVLLFDRLLTETERDALGRHLHGKHQWLTHPPAPPSGLRVTALSAQQASLMWHHSPGPATTVHLIERRTGDGPGVVVARVRDATSWLDATLSAGTQYHYRVKAWNYAVESDWTDEVGVVTPLEGEGLPLGELQLWLRADAGVVRNGSNGTVRVWLDQSGRNHHALQTTAAQQPVWVEATDDGRPMVRFNPAHYPRMRFPDFMSGNTAAEVFAVLRAATNKPASSRGLWWFGTAGTAGHYPANSGAIHEGFGRANTLNTGAPSHPLDQLHLYNVSASASEWASRLNGQVHHVATPVAPQFPGAPWLGSSGQYGTPTFDGDIAEIMLFSRVLTPGERASVGLYLNAIHQFVSLPSDILELSAQVLSSSQVALSWIHAGVTDHGPYTYRIERRVVGGGPFQVVAQVDRDTRYLDSGLASGTLYTYRVRQALQPGAEPSNEVTVTTLDGGAALPLSDVALWLRAEDVPCPDGGAVSEWFDFAKPTLKAAQTNEAWQPGWLADAFDGRPAVRFVDGAFLQLPTVLSNAAAADVFVVLSAQTNLPPANRGLWRFNTNAPSWFPDTNGAVSDAFGSAASQTSIAPLPSLDRPLIYNVAAAAGLWQSRMNGPVKQSLATNNVTFNGVPLLGRSLGGPAEGFAGDIAELLVFKRALSLPERQAVRDGLALKHGIPLELPSIPSNLITVRTSPGERVMSWDALTGSENGLESVFVVERRADEDGPFLPLATLPRTNASFADINGMVAVNYAYRLRAINEVGEVASDPMTAPLTDTDGDGLPDYVEALLGTDFDNPDTDGDGLPDGWEVRHGLNPLRSDGRHGATGDFDYDGLSNTDEYAQGSDPADGVHGAGNHLKLEIHRPN